MTVKTDNPDALDNPNTPDDLPLDLSLAAIVTLLSSSALRGVTASKLAALRRHLETAAQTIGKTPSRDGHLANALRDALQNWQGVCCRCAASHENVPAPRSRQLH